jgi:hypothetical protein
MKRLKMRPNAVGPGSSKHPYCYPWLGWRLTRAQWAATLTVLAVGAGLICLYRVYLRSNDVAPDSSAGYSFAVAGTLLLLLTGAGYVLRKRLRRHWPGRLNTMLTWHMAGGLLGLLLIVLHAAGNFNPRTGTYALYGLIGVVVSGIVGRVLDRLCPRLAANAALQAMAASGEEHLARLERESGALADGESPHRSAPRRSGAHGTPWDLAYYHLDPEIDEIPALLGQGHRGFSLAAPPAHLDRSVIMRQAATFRAALDREQFFLTLIRVWRHLHLLISLVALGLLLWHLAYAASLLLR